MKNIFKSILLSIFMFSTIFAFSHEEEGTIKREFNIKKNTIIEFMNKNSDLEVKTWNKQMVKLECHYKLRANDREDIDTVIEALKELGVKQSDDKISISTSIFTNVKSIVISGVVNKIVATVTSGPVVNLKQYKVEYVLTVPDNHDFHLKQKYSDLNLPDYHGKLDLDLHDVDMRAGNLENAQFLKAKYSNLKISSLGDCELDVYDTDIELEIMDDLNLKSKYSKLNIKKVGAVIMDSYDDKIYLTEVKSIEGQSKYSDFGIGNIDHGNLILYDCDITGKNCGKLRMEAKYSGITFNNVAIFEFPECYDNKLNVAFVGEFSTTSKYTEFKFGRIASMLDINSHDDKVEVLSIDEDFYYISINGKYTKANLNIEGNPRYFADFDFKYTKRNLPDNLMYSDVQTKSSQFVAKGRTEGLKKTDKPKITKNDEGIRKATIGKINIKQYNGSLSIY